MAFLLNDIVSKKCISEFAKIIFAFKFIIALVPHTLGVAGFGAAMAKFKNHTTHNHS